jgi:hypothetical protein
MFITRPDAAAANTSFTYNNTPPPQPPLPSDLCTERNAASPTIIPAQLTLPSDLLPATLQSCAMTGQFLQVSNRARQHNIHVGTHYTIVFKTACTYDVVRSNGVVERGRFEYRRASDASLTNSAGGNHRYAVVHFEPTESEHHQHQLRFCHEGRRDNQWQALLTARTRGRGTLESAFGIANFELRPL